MPTRYPKYVYDDPVTGQTLRAWYQEDFEAIRLGYVCGHCGEDYNGIFLLECPACAQAREALEQFGHVRDYPDMMPGRDAPAPEGQL